jgi:hypothetical protein
LKGERTAAYDERNALDYREMSRRIADALDEMERDQSIPATEKELARRAKCSRGTLRNRQYPIARLKGIKDRRRLNGSKPKNATGGHKAATESHIEDKKALMGQLEKSRTECAIWFDKYNESERARNKVQRERELLLSKNRSLKEMYDELVNKVGQLEAARDTGKRKKRVLTFPKAVKNRGQGRDRKEGVDD